MCRGANDWRVPVPLHRDEAVKMRGLALTSDANLSQYRRGGESRGDGRSGGIPLRHTQPWAASAAGERVGTFSKAPGRPGSSAPRGPDGATRITPTRIIGLHRWGHEV